MSRTWIERLIVALLALQTLALGGCATSKNALLTHGARTMLDIWNQETAGNGGDHRAACTLLDAREALRRPLTGTDILAAPGIEAAYTRTAQNEIYSQFHRLPNPDLVMYVFPHLAGSEPVPVPGYSTVFPLYQRVHYALPGESGEDE